MRRNVGAWRVWVAILPLGAAVGLLGILAPATPHRVPLLLLRLLPHEDLLLPGLLTFAAIALVHLFACLAAIWFALDLLKRTPGAAPFAKAGVALAVVAMLLIAASPWLGLRAVDVTAYAVRNVLRDAGAAGGFIRPRWWWVRPVDAAMLIPTFAGVSAVAMMSAAAWAQLPLFRRLLEARVLPALEERRSAWALAAEQLDAVERRKRSAAALAQAQAARINQINDRLKRCLSVLAIVLVTSTVAASLFFHLPNSIAAAAKPVDRDFSFVQFSDEISIFWGCVYTLTLAVAVGLPLYLLQERVRRFLEPPILSEEADARRTQLATAGPLSSVSQQLKFVGTLVAPLVAGPVANLVQAFAKGG